MKIPVSCNKDCGAGCPLQAEVENGRIIKINDSDEKGEWMSGCGRGYRAHRLIYHPDRLKKPLIKDPSSGSFREAGWDEALNYTAENLLRIRDSYGPRSILHSGGSGSCRGALHNSHKLAVRFLSLFGGCTSSSDSYSSAATSFAAPYVYGTSYCGFDAAAIKDSRFVFMPGANIADLRFGCELFNRLRALRKSGVPMIILDPRKTRSVSGLDAEWIQILPGTDAAFVAAVIYELLEHGGADEVFIERCTHGFELFRSWLYEQPVKNAEWASGICGCPATSVRTVAEHYRRYSPAALIPGLSIQRNLGGEDAARMMAVLQAVTGNAGRSGGSSGINPWGRLPGPRCGKLGRSPESAGARMRFSPVYVWPDMVLDPDLEPPLKASYNIGGNYLVQGADTNKSVRAWNSLEFSVTHELFMTPTAAASDVVLPVADFLERNDIVFPEGNFLLYSSRAVEPPAGVKTDYEILCLLAGKLGFGEAFSEGRTEDDWLDFFIEASDIEDSAEFKSRGIWFGKDCSRTAFTDFAADPLAHPLQTPSGRIEISSIEFEKAGGNLFPVYTPIKTGRAFRMVTPHSGRRINSQFKMMESPVNGSLFMNAEDAAAMGIEQGSPVRVISSSGSIETVADISMEMMRGTACLDCSYSNVLTSSVPTLPSKGARTHSTFVDIEPA
ncbi:MAG: molybdopterin-dependent oxidoreductase [Spirochaetales bacterium]|uniref:Molybdopterin-dependent oxidoreductase n=1 Tax=Candidatus Thalassospirochaeta sargassi TaxID=3119039 RepID=A0AAJ1IDM4_9SPIO|nr:molybdopterin-dependent oxidoreductase [Spirochaetales bacterium]